MEKKTLIACVNSNKDAKITTLGRKLIEAVEKDKK